MTEAIAVRVLELTLHDQRIGYLAGFANGRNVLTFDDNYRADPERPTFTLTTHPKFPRSGELMATPWARNQTLNPVLSNLLPEGSLRELLTKMLKVHIDNEFELLRHLGGDLPGAIIATPMPPDKVPQSVLGTHEEHVVPVEATALKGADHFSLAGVQIKFSMREQDGRYNLTKNGQLGDWIVKTPSTKHPHVPFSEFSAMKMAEMAGVSIPEVRLIDIDTLDNLPSINLPDERHAYAIRRFDRQGNTRIHMEDFAQVLQQYAHDKYENANYAQIARILYQYSGDGLMDIKEFAGRLLVNILLGNGDAHLKNWSLIYTDQFTPRLSPAYDILPTLVYMHDEREFAMNLFRGRSKDWYKTTLTDFEEWAGKSDIPWRPVQAQLKTMLDRARTLWPNALKDLPMEDEHKEMLRKHWMALQPDFRLNS